MKHDSDMDDMIKRAAAEALDIRYSWADGRDQSDYDYEFSGRFVKRMEKICRLAEHSYISLGRFRLRRAATAALIAAILMVLAGCTYAVTQAVIHWDEKQNDRNGTLDVYFDIDDPDGTLVDKGLRKPDTPEGYEIVSEEKDDGSYYMVEYRCKDSDILYMQESGIENLGLTLNNEDNDCTEININGYKGYYRKFETGALSLTWTDGIYLYELNGMAEISILKEMAESLK